MKIVQKEKYTDVYLTECASTKYGFILKHKLGMIYRKLMSAKILLNKTKFGKWSLLWVILTYIIKIPSYLFIINRKLNNGSELVFINAIITRRMV